MLVAKYNYHKVAVRKILAQLPLCEYNAPEHGDASSQRQLRIRGHFFNYIKSFSFPGNFYNGFGFLKETRRPSSVHISHSVELGPFGTSSSSELSDSASASVSKNLG